MQRVLFRRHQSDAPETAKTCISDQLPPGVSREARDHLRETRKEIGMFGVRTAVTDLALMRTPETSSSRVTHRDRARVWEHHSSHSL